MTESPEQTKSSSHLNIRLKHASPPKQKASSPSSPNVSRLVNSDYERTQRLQKLRDEYFKKESESMTPCTKPVSPKSKNSKESEKGESTEPTAKTFSFDPISNFESIEQKNLARKQKPIWDDEGKLLISPELIPQIDSTKETENKESEPLSSPTGRKVQLPSEHLLATKPAINTNDQKPPSPKVTQAEFIDFQERQQRLLDHRNEINISAEKLIKKEADQKHMCPRSAQILAKAEKRGEKLSPTQNKYVEEQYTFQPDMSLSNKKIKEDHLLYSAAEKKKNYAEQNRKVKSFLERNNLNSPSPTKLPQKNDASDQISPQSETKKSMIQKKTESPVSLNSTPKLQDRQFASPNTKNSPRELEKNDDEIKPMKKPKIPSSTQKLILLVNKLKEEADDERYNEKHQSLYERSISTLKRRSGKEKQKPSKSKPSEEDEYVIEEEEEEIAE